MYQLWSSPRGILNESGSITFSTSPTSNTDSDRINRYWELIDETAELFKGELGDIHVLESMSLKELIKRRDIRIQRKLKEAEEEKRLREKEAREREMREIRDRIRKR
jgi:hypothetical protein